MDRSTRRGLAALALVVLAAAAGWLGRAPLARTAGPVDTTRISADERAAGPRFAADVAAGDRAWILAAIAGARPEAQQLIAEVDGLIEFRTHRGDPLGVTRSLVGPASAEFVIDLDIAALDGRRTTDRGVVVLHELGHAIDLAIVSQETNDVLEEGIPRTGTCGGAATGLTGSCTEPAERFADTFAKWALRGSVSAVGAGYDVASPPSLEGWGAPLAALAVEVSRR